MPPYKKKQTYININIDEQHRNKLIKSLDNFFENDINQNCITTSNASSILSNSIVTVVNTTDTNTTQASDIAHNVLNGTSATFANTKISSLHETYMKPEYNIIFSHTEIRSKIENLNEDEMSEVFRIIKNGTDKYTINKNGIFINLNSLKFVTIKALSNFLLFCESNRKLINDDEKARELYKHIVNND
jgi:hypothetical protein